MSIEYTLALTSPPTKGEHVKRAQTVLNGNNVFKDDWFRGRIDGEFGPITSRSCIRAKYWIGYAQDDLKGTYGPTLDAYLLGEAELTPLMLARIEKRMEAAEEKPIREKMFAEAIKHLGDKERTGRNDIWVTDWYGVRGAWCAMFETYCGVKVGSKAFKQGTTGVNGKWPGSGTYAYVPFLVFDARHGLNGLQVISKDEVKKGDLIAFDWDGGVADHTGFFEAWVNKSTGTFKSVEGNTSPDDSGSQSNGGGVFRRGERPGSGDTRKLSQVETFIRVGR